MKLYFYNHGEFDTTAMLTFGVSAKESENPLGQFGTGFKYAIAIILRLGGEIAIRTKGKEYVFTSEHRNIRGQDFDIVCMNGNEAGFTTHLGAHWEPWHAFRELYANCRDEDGFVDDKAEHEPGYDTVVEVNCREIYQAWEDRFKYFLFGKKPIFVKNDVEVYEGFTGRFYYKGVAVADADPSLFTFNLLSGVDLTEDRTAMYVDCDIKGPIARALQSSDDTELLSQILSSKLEGDAKLPYSPNYPSTETFINTCNKLMNQNQGVATQALNVISKHNQEKKIWPEIDLTEVQEKMLTKAKTFLCSIDIDVSVYELKVVKGLGDGVMGRAHNGVIYLSLIPFEQGTKQVASTILEEFVHLDHKCADFDRRMQSWLFDKVLSIGEEMAGEPL